MQLSENFQGVGQINVAEGRTPQVIREAALQSATPTTIEETWQATNLFCYMRAELAEETGPLTTKQEATHEYSFPTEKERNEWVAGHGEPFQARSETSSAADLKTARRTVTTTVTRSNGPGALIGNETSETDTEESLLPLEVPLRLQLLLNNRMVWQQADTLAFELDGTYEAPGLLRGSATLSLYVDLTNPIYVRSGDTLTFRAAITNPIPAQWKILSGRYQETKAGAFTENTPPDSFAIWYDSLLDPSTVRGERR